MINLTIRLRLLWQLHSMTLILIFLHLDIDNGYDAFSLSENRTTSSDQPGHDRQSSHCFLD